MGWGLPLEYNNAVVQIRVEFSFGYDDLVKMASEVDAGPKLLTATTSPVKRT